MNKLIVLVVIAAAVGFGVWKITSSKGPDLKIEGNDVLLATGDLDVRFTKGKPLDDTFMLFGGGRIDHRNAIANVTIAGLSVRHARPIYRRYPDFDRCASPGAALAKKRVISLEMVPADGETLEFLETSLKDFDESIHGDGARVCVELQGSRLKLASVKVREVDEDVTDTIQMDDFYLIDSASRVDCRQALGG
jgi:hypothetical protein